MRPFLAPGISAHLLFKAQSNLREAHHIYIYGCPRRFTGCFPTTQTQFCLKISTQQLDEFPLSRVSFNVGGFLILLVAGEASHRAQRFRRPGRCRRSECAWWTATGEGTDAGLGDGQQTPKERGETYTGTVDNLM